MIEANDIAEASRSVSALKKRPPDMTPARLAHHVSCGRHSGIPDCCIGWFVDVWIGQGACMTVEGQVRLRAVSFGYVPCPPCLSRGNRVVVLACDCTWSAKGHT